MIVLDEPTSYLDIRHKLELLNLLKRLVHQKQLAVVMSLHELDLAQRVSDTVVCVNGSRIERCGTPEEIFAADYIRRLYGLTGGSYEPVFGSVELEAIPGPPRVFVIGGGGSGVPAASAAGHCLCRGHSGPERPGLSHREGAGRQSGGGSTLCANPPGDAGSGQAGTQCLRERRVHAAGVRPAERGQPGAVGLCRPAGKAEHACVNLAAATPPRLNAVRRMCAVLLCTVRQKQKSQRTRNRPPCGGIPPQGGLFLSLRLNAGLNADLKCRLYKMLSIIQTGILRSGFRILNSAFKMRNA